jgi:hypothetical protein
VFGLSRETVAKMCRFSLPPGHTRSAPAGKPKLGRLLGVIDAILDADRTGPVKQRHTARRIFERLRDEHGFGGGYTVVKDHVRLSRARGRETFVPLAHPPGHAQMDFGEAIGVVGGVRQKLHFFCLDALSVASAVGSCNGAACALSASRLSEKTGTAVPVGRAIRRAWAPTRQDIATTQAPTV